MIQYLKWDSDFFQKKVGSIFLNNESNLDLENLLNFDLVYIIVNETID